MIAGVADTHAAVWHLFDDARLSITAGNFIDTAAKQARHVVVSAISLAEVVYLVEKNRLPPNAYSDLMTALAKVLAICAGTTAQCGTVPPPPPGAGCVVPKPGPRGATPRAGVDSPGAVVKPSDRLVW